jgi:hypothetical protein
MIHRLFAGVFFAALVSGCVSNQSVSTVQAGDTQKSCPVLRAELSKLGAKFEDVKDDSGVTGKNVGLAILFWPGIIVNEVRSNKNEDSIDARITHLTTIYNEKCLGEKSSNSSLSEQLKELKDLHDQGLITDDELKSSRKKVLDGV